MLQQQQLAMVGAAREKERERERERERESFTSVYLFPLTAARAAAAWWYGDGRDARLLTASSTAVPSRQLYNGDGIYLHWGRRRRGRGNGAALLAVNATISIH